MSQRITITVKNENSLKQIDEYCCKHKTSRSSLISSILKSACPLLSEINQYTQLTNELESKLFSPDKSSMNYQGKASTFSLAEHLLDIWQTHIIEKGVIIDQHAYPHAFKSPKVGLKEKISIQEELEHYISEPNIKKAIFIYTDRHVHYKLHKAGGLSNTILIKNTEYKNYVFDFNGIINIPMNDIVFFGIEEAIKKSKVQLKHTYEAFIPIYHTNHQCILIGVIDRNNGNKRIDKSSNTIIINPL
ncbi:hypothetical protein AB7Y04_05560 [Providencia rettgeri]|uniref:hypothetical protein n=1 Tax=Providencia TaxID=586 RepID=UPI0032DBCCA2